MYIYIYFIPEQLFGKNRLLCIFFPPCCKSGEIIWCLCGDGIFFISGRSGIITHGPPSKGFGPGGRIGVILLQRLLSPDWPRTSKLKSKMQMSIVANIVNDNWNYQSWNTIVMKNTMRLFVIGIGKLYLKFHITL